MGEEKKKKATCTGRTTWKTVKRRMEDEDTVSGGRDGGQECCSCGEGAGAGGLGQRSDTDKRIKCYTEKM